MLVNIKNQTTRVVMLRLNSGQTLYLGPNTSSEKISETEVRDNSRLRRLEERGIIERPKVEPQKLSRKISRKKPTPSKRKNSTVSKRISKGKKKLNHT